MEKRKSCNSMSRRQFIGSVMLVATSAALINACKTTDYQIGAYTRAWGKRDYRVALDGMVETGYKFVGLSVHEKGRVLDRNSSFEEAAAVGEEIKSRGLKLITLSAGTHDTRASIDEGIVQLKHIIDLSVICNASSVQLNDPANPEIEEYYYKVIAECCDYAADKGVGLNIHPHGSSGAQIRVQIEKVGHENLKLLYDPGNIGFYSHGEIDPLEDAEYLDGILYGMSVKDFRLPRDVNITPGTGLVEFPELMARLRQGGFTQGPLIVECLNPGDLDYVNAEAIKTREFLEEIIDKIK